MKNLINSVISSNKGWIVRQILKYVAMGGAALSTWLVSQGASAGDVELVVSGLTTVFTGSIEIVLSKLASKIASE